MNNKTEFYKAINEVVSQPLKEAIKRIHAKFSEAPAPTPTPTPTPVALEKTVITKDGKTLSIAGDTIAVDAMVMDTTSGTPVPLEGKVELEDGSMIVAVAGKITEYMPAPTATPPMDMTAATTALKAEFAAQKVAFEKEVNTKLSAQEAKIKELEEASKDLVEINKSVIAFMNIMMETPVPEKKKVIEPVDFSKMTPLEKHRYHKKHAI